MPLILYFTILGILLFFSVIDIKTKKIPNKYLPLFLIPFFSYLIFDNQLYLNWPMTLWYPFVVLIGGFVLFLFKIMGAGDAKLLFLLFLCIPNQEKNNFLKILIITTIMISILRISLQIIRKREQFWIDLITFNVKGLFNLVSERYSYAPVIFLSWVGYFINLLNLF
jgi:prepilin peptidase CpaA